MDVCLLWVLCVVSYRSLREADHSSRGVLPTVVRRCVWSRNLVNEEVLAHWELSRQKKPKLFRMTLVIHCVYLEQTFRASDLSVRRVMSAVSSSVSSDCFSSLKSPSRQQSGNYFLFFRDQTTEKSSYRYFDFSTQQLPNRLTFRAQVFILHKYLKCLHQCWS